MTTLSAAETATLANGGSITITGIKVAPPVVVPPIVVVTPPVVGSIPVYMNGHFYWPNDYSWGGVSANYSDTSGAPVGSNFDVKVSVPSAFGGWQPSNANGVTIVLPAAGHLELDMKPTVTGQKWNLQAHFDENEATGVGPILNLLSYGPPPVVGVWAHYSVPNKDLLGKLTSLWKFGIQDQTGGGNFWFVNNVQFTP